MKNQNSCYTYFKIVGDFNPTEISSLLKIKAEKSWRIGDERIDGSRYDFALWETGRCNDYDIEVANQMRKTIASLMDKIDLLNKIRQEYDVSFYLEIVPTVYAEDSAPCLAPTLDVIDFCYATRTEIDIDMYVMDSSDDINEDETDR